MSNSKWKIGESVVVRPANKQGKIISSGSVADGYSVNESVQVEYTDGSSEWISSDNISKFLVEVDPKNNNTFLTE